MNVEPVIHALERNFKERLRFHDRVLIADEPYRPVARLTNGFNIVHEDDPERTMFLSDFELAQLLRTKKAKIKRNKNHPVNKRLDLIHGDKTLSDFKDGDRIRSVLLEKLINAMLQEGSKTGKKVPRSDKSRGWLLNEWEKIVKTVKNSTRWDVDEDTYVAPSLATINRKFREYVASGGNILALVPRHRGPGKKPVIWCPESLAFAYKEAEGFLNELKPTRAFVYLRYKAALWAVNEQRELEKKPPLHPFSRSKFEKIINSFSAYETMVAREGEEFAQKHFAPNVRGIEVDRPGQRVEIDEVKADMATLVAMSGDYVNIPKELFKLLKKVRIWLVVVIDVATRYILAIKATLNPSGDAAVAAMRMAMSDKTLQSRVAGARTDWFGHLVPEEVYSDNGSAFLSEQFVSGLQALGITVVRPPAGQPYRRPFIESFFNGIGPLWTSFFQGRTFRSILEKGDYDPKEHASLLNDEFVKVITQITCDVYHNRPHDSLGGKTPQNAYIEACQEHGVMSPPGPEEMLRAFGAVEQGTVGKYGITRLGISYRNETLDLEMSTHGKIKFDIKVDQSRLNDILVKGKKGWFLVENTVGLTSEMSELEWIAARKADLAENKDQSNAGLATIYAAVNRMRQIGEAAAIRAGHTPMTPVSEKQKRARARLFHGYEPAPQSGSDVALLSDLTIAPDPLRDGMIGSTKTVDVDATSQVVPANSGKSKFDRVKREL
ncbi:DDE-type integrase/transposase/recombinase [Pararhizobium sp. DWP3-4]|uniref:DDE-type integrase/transposase/recombinase n=1 Tax=Pararhizobium sp. DWP3-4 TaxID=2804565 RepID=UPI003CFA4DF2